MARNTGKQSETPTQTPVVAAATDELLAKRAPFSLKIRRRLAGQGDIYVLFRTGKDGVDREVDTYPSIESALGTMQHALEVDGSIAKTLLQEYEDRIKLGR